MKTNPANELPKDSFFSFLSDGSLQADQSDLFALKDLVDDLIRQVENEREENGIADFRYRGKIWNTLSLVILQTMTLVIAGEIGNGNEECI